MPIRFDNSAERKAFDLLKSTGPAGSMIPGLMNRVAEFVANPDTVSVLTYQRMIETDETVGAAVDLLIRSVVGRLGEYAHPDPNISQFVNAAFDAMKGTLHSTAREIMTAKWAGFSVTEKVLGMGTFDGRPVISWERLQTLPPGSMAFEVDKFGQVTDNGILQFEHGLNASPGWLLNNLVAQDSWAAAGNKPWPQRFGFRFGNATHIPKDSVVHYVSGSPIFGNPYGRSPLRRAYKSWMLKDLCLRMLLVGLDRKGTPLIVAHAPNTDVALFDHLGNPIIKDTDTGEQAVENAQVLLAKQLENLHQESALVLGPEDEYKLAAVEFGTAGEEFLNAIQYLNRAIVRSMLLPSLILEEGLNSGSLALGQAHQDTFATIVAGESNELQAVLIDQLVKDLVIMNFGEQSDGYGHFLPVALNVAEKTVLAEMFRELSESGFIRSTLFEDWELVRRSLDLPADAEIYDQGVQADENRGREGETPEEKADRLAQEAAEKAAEGSGDSELSRPRGRIVMLDQFARNSERERAEASAPRAKTAPREQRLHIARAS